MTDEEYRGVLFLLDKDFGNSNDWEKFRNGNKNHLILKRHEIESYLINPDILSQSNLLKKEYKDNGKLKETICKLAQQRLFIDAANYVIYHHKIKIVPTPEDYKTLENFKELDVSLERLIQDCSKYIDKERIREKVTNLFKDRLFYLTGNHEHTIVFGSGNWQNEMSCKEIFNTLLNQCFDWKDAGTDLKKADLIINNFRDILNKKEIMNNVEKYMLGDLQEISEAIRQRVLNF
jgi:hypothetical protein